MNLSELSDFAIDVLKKLIETPSFSREEQGTMAIFEHIFREKNIPFQTIGNNIWAKNKFFSPEKDTILLNSHHDTVKPNAGYTRAEAKLRNKLRQERIIVHHLQ